MLATPESTLGFAQFGFHAPRAPMKLGYTQLAYQSRDFALAGLLFRQRVVA
jgi:hypothetical protein